MKRITSEIKKQVISDVLDRGIAIHIVEAKYGVPAMIINKWVDDYEDALAGPVSDPSRAGQDESQQSKEAVSKTTSTSKDDDVAITGAEVIETELAKERVEAEVVAKTQNPLDNPARSPSTVRLFALVVLIGLVGGVWFCWEVINSAPESANRPPDIHSAGDPPAAEDLSNDTHPLFRTPISEGTGSRPAVKTRFVVAEDQVFDFGADEFYLRIRSERFPAALFVLLPVSVGEQKFGTNDRYVRLPFECEVGDELVVELLKATGLNVNDRRSLLSALERPGFCIIKDSQIFKPTDEFLAVLESGVNAGENPLEYPDVLGKKVVQRVRRSLLKVQSVITVKLDEVLSENIENPLEFDLTSTEEEQLQLLIYAPQ